VSVSRSRVRVCIRLLTAPDFCKAGHSQIQMSERLADPGCAVFAGSPAHFGKFIAEEIEKWGKVIKLAGIKPE
jgi:hypothetical protein